MTNRNYAMLPVFIAVLLIPQLFFWWLAPLAAVARLVIYLGATFINCATLVTLFIAYWKHGIRKVAGLAVVSGILETATFIVCIILFASNVTIRSAAYVLTITGLFHLIVLIPMVCSVFKPERISVAVINGATEETMPIVPSSDARPRLPASNHNEGNRTQTRNGYKALPPRNR